MSGCFLCSTLRGYPEGQGLALKDPKPMVPKLKSPVSFKILVSRYYPQKHGLLAWVWMGVRIFKSSIGNSNVANIKTLISANSSQSGVQTSSISITWNLLKMQILGLRPDLSNQSYWG